MTHDELFEKIREYESKWGKLGHTNILHPERQAINHSGILSNNNNEFPQGGKNTMLKMTNDFYEFRRKVAEGKEKNKLAHSVTISPDALNERYYQEQLDKNTLIHARRKGQDAENHKYFTKEDVNGSPRYFYSAEEYDAYKNNKKRSSMNSAEAHAAMNKKSQDALDNYNNNAKADNIRKIVEVSKNGGADAAAQAFKDTSDYKLYMQMIQKIVDMGVDPRTASTKEMKALGEDINQALNDAEKNLKEYFDAVPGLKKSAREYAIADLEDMINRSKKGSTENASREDSLSGKVNAIGEKIGSGISDKIRHSSEDEGVMSEWRAFKARANKGAQKNRLAHSSIISPAELNARYEEELLKEYIAIHPESDDNIMHAEYYNKIDDYYGKGRHRYFYSQAEWDAYQDGLGQAKFREHQNTVNQMKKESADRAAQTQKLANQKQEASNRANMGGYEEYQRNKAEEKAANRAKLSEEASNQRYNAENKSIISAQNYANAKAAAENERKKEYSSQRSGMTGYNKYQENLKADREADARQKEIDAKKEVSAQKSGMTDYNKYQENLKADQEADRREKQKVEASQRSGMEGYNDYKKYKSAKDEADRRNDAEGLEKFQAKKKAEEDLKKQRAETVAKNKAADEAKKASEDEQHRNEKNARLTSEKEAKDAKDAKIAELTEQLNKVRSGNAKEATASREAAEAAGRKTEYDRINAERDAEHESDVEKRKTREKYAKAGEKATNVIENAIKPYNNKINDLNEKYDNMNDKSSSEAREIKSQISKMETERDNAFDKVYGEIMDEIDEQYNSLLKSGNKAEAAELNSMRNALKSSYEADPKDIKKKFPLYYNVTHNTASTAGSGKSGHKF